MAFAVTFGEGSVGCGECLHGGVGVVAPPGGGAEGGVVAEVFEGFPECVESADGFGVEVPLWAPAEAGGG